MQNRFTKEVLTTEIITLNEEMIFNHLPEAIAPSENLIQRLLNYSRSVEVRKTKSAGVVTTTLS